MGHDPFAPGVHVFHIKTQVIGKIKKVTDGLIHVQIAKNKPLQVWPKKELKVWDAREELQRRLKRGGYIRDIFNKLNSK